jgi:hypothetical protein
MTMWSVYHITVWIANEERQWVREPRLNRCRKLIPRDDENRCLYGREFKEVADGYAATRKMVAAPAMENRSSARPSVGSCERTASHRV